MAAISVPFINEYGGESGSYHVFMERLRGKAEYAFYFVRSDWMNKTQFVAKIADGGDLEWTEFKEDGSMSPTFVMNAKEAELVNAFANLFKKPGMTQKDEGELIATKIHLEDMRKLVFDPATIIAREIPSPEKDDNS